MSFAILSSTTYHQDMQFFPDIKPHHHHNQCTHIKEQQDLLHFCRHTVFRLIVNKLLHHHQQNCFIISLTFLALYQVLSKEICFCHRYSTKEFSVLGFFSTTLVQKLSLLRWSSLLEIRKTCSFPPSLHLYHTYGVILSAKHPMYLSTTVLTVLPSLYEQIIELIRMIYACTTPYMYCYVRTVHTVCTVRTNAAREQLSSQSRDHIFAHNGQTFDPDCTILALGHSHFVRYFGPAHRVIQIHLCVSSWFEEMVLGKLKSNSHCESFCYPESIRISVNPEYI